MNLSDRYQQAVADGALKPDAAQAAAIEHLSALARALDAYKPGGFSLFGRKPEAPRGLYIWGDVGRGKSILMDLFFETVSIEPRQRVHFNAFMADVNARIHAMRQLPDVHDPIAPVARDIAKQARLLCFDEFQVTDIADAMILGRLFEHLFEAGTVIVATSNVAPGRLYEGGLNRQLFLPFIAQIKQRLEVVELNGATDYRLHRLSGLPVYLTPLSHETDRAMDATWRRLTGTDKGNSLTLTILERDLVVPQAARGVARFSFAELCEAPLAATDYLAIAQHFHTLLIDHIPQFGEDMRNPARRFVVLIDTLYDDGVKLICSAAAEPEALYQAGEGAEAFRRTASRLAEMRSDDYLKRGHGIHGLQ